MVGLVIVYTLSRYFGVSGCKEITQLVEEVLKIFCILFSCNLCYNLGLAMFQLYHSEGCNAGETVFHWCYVNRSEERRVGKECRL